VATPRGADPADADVRRRLVIADDDRRGDGADADGDEDEARDCAVFICLSSG